MATPLIAIARMPSASARVTAAATTWSTDSRGRRPSAGRASSRLVDGLATLARHPQAVVPTVEEVTGRPGTTFATWARANAAAFC
ncbi:hypothetical protein ACWDWO_11675 [Actinopolymorpha singaporensis]